MLGGTVRIVHEFVILTGEQWLSEEGNFVFNANGLNIAPEAHEYYEIRQQTHVVSLFI